MTLEKQLREKLKALVFDEWDYDDFVKEGLDSYVKAIIQAFKDDGWSKSITIPYMKFKSSKDLSEKLKKAWEKTDE